MDSVVFGWRLASPMVLVSLAAAQGTGMCDGTSLMADPVRAACSGGTVGPGNLSSPSTPVPPSGPTTGGGGGNGGGRGSPAPNSPTGAVTGHQWLNKFLGDYFGSSLGDPNAAVDLGQVAGIGGSGTVHSASGEYRYAFPLYSLQGFLAGHGVQVGLTYRTYQVDNWRGSGADPVAALEDPLGPGWRPSWGDLLVNLPQTAGGDVTRIDSNGASWTSTSPTVTYDSQNNPIYTYPGRAGSRMVYEWRSAPILDGGYVWFRELPDRTRIEYEVIDPGSNPVGRVRRIYRGSHSSPDWQITYSYTLSTSTLVSSIQDPRGVTLTYQYVTPPPATGHPRIQQIDVSAPWMSQTEAAKYTTYFYYAAASPYQLTEIKQPSRTFVCDANRNGQYDLPSEQYTAHIRTVFGTASSSNRISTVSDWSLGSQRLWQQITYDTTSGYTWRVSEQLTGEAGYSGGQGQRLHAFFYGTDASGNATTEWRQYLDATNYIKRFSTADTGPTASPTQRHVKKLVEYISAVDPRPSGQYNYGTLTWEYSWDACNCNSLTRVKTPRGITYEWTYDSAGRALPTSATTTPVGGGTVLSRSWTYSSWDEADYRMASRLTGFTTADQISASVTNTLNSEGVQSQVFITAVGSDSLYTTQEDLKGRVSWHEEMPFAVDFQLGGGTSKKRVRFIYQDSDASAADYRLLVQVHRFYDSTNFYDVSFTYEGLGYPRTYMDEKDRVTTYTCDVIGNVIQIDSPTTASGKGTATYGATTTIVPTLWGNQAGIVSRTAHDADGSAYTKATVTSHLVTDYFGRPWKVFADKEAMGSSSSSWLTVEYVYDRVDRLTSVVGPGRREQQIVMDDHGRVYQEKTKLDSSSWATRTFCQDEDGLLLKATDATNVTVDYVIDTYGRPGQASFPGNKSVVIGYDAEHRVLTTEYKVGTTPTTMRTVTRTRDTLGRVHVQAVSLPGTAVVDSTTYDFTGLGRVYHVVDNNGRQRSTYFDSLGRARRTTDHLTSNSQNETLFAYDVTDCLVTLEDKPQKETSSGTFQQVTYKTTFDLDAWDRVIQENRFGDTTGVLATRLWGRDSLGRLTWTKDGVTKVTEYAYDALGRQLSKTLKPRTGASESPVTLTIAWDDNPSDTSLALAVTREDGLDHPSVYLYDLADRLKERRVPGYSATSGANRWEYTRDAEGRVETWKDGNNTLVHQVFDSEKRVTRRWAGAHTVALSIMATEEAFGYDDFNRVNAAQTWWWAFADPTTGVRSSGAYSLVNACTSRDGFGRLLSEDFGYGDNGAHAPQATRSSVSGWTAGSTEDTRFRRSLQTGTGWRLDYSPDAAGKPSSASLWVPGASSSQGYASWRYLGGQALAKTQVPGSSTSQYVATGYSFDSLRYLTGIAATYGTGGTGTSIYSLTMTRDVEGNVLDNQFTKANGRAGDWFQLDGFDRLREAKMGVTGFSNWSSVTYDTRTAYSLDAAQNRTQVENQVWGQTAQTTGYTLETDSNRYKQVDSTYYTYDGNGNLVSDGWYVYVYDYLDRLSEVYLITYPAGATGGSESGTAVYGPTIQKARRGKRTEVTLPAAASLVAQARARWSRLTATSDPLANGLGGSAVNENLASGASTEQPVLVLVAYYGYDPMNRRVLKALPTQATWHGYDGWQMTDEHDGNFAKVRVHLDGPGIDEHLGFSNYNAGNQTWTRYTLVQGNLGHVVAALDSSGQVVEKYEYEPDGSRHIFDGSGNPRDTTQIGLAAGYTGRDHDEESGLIYFRHRYYSGALGRFLTNDPAGPWLDRENWGNGYGYVGCRQIRAEDPAGLFTINVVYLGSDANLNSDARGWAELDAATDPDGGVVLILDANGKLADIKKVEHNPKKEINPGRKGKVNLGVMPGHGATWPPEPVIEPEDGTVVEPDKSVSQMMASITGYLDGRCHPYKPDTIRVYQCWGWYVPSDEERKKRNPASELKEAFPDADVEAPDCKVVISRNSPNVKLVPKVDGLIEGRWRKVECQRR